MNTILGRLIRRICVLAVLVATLAVVYITPPARATDACSECDLNYLYCNSACNSDYNDCLNSGNNSQFVCEFVHALCWDGCWTVYNNCLYNNPGCTVTYPNGSGTPASSCRGRSACDNDCKATFLDCLHNGGESCAEDYHSCSVGCCP